MKKIFILIGGVLMIIFITFLTGCSTLSAFDATFDFKVIHAGPGSVGGFQNPNILEKIETFEQLADFTYVNNIHPFEPEHELYERHMEQLFRNFDEEFFLENSLVVVSNSWMRSAEVVRFNSIGRIENDLVIRISYSVNKSGDVVVVNDDAIMWFALVALNRYSLYEIDNIRLEVGR